MTNKPPKGSVQAFLAHRARTSSVPFNEHDICPKSTKLTVREFTSVSKHLDNDFVELLLAEARKRARETLYQEDVERCSQCEAIAPAIFIPN